MKEQKITGTIVAMMFVLIFLLGFIGGALAEASKTREGVLECEQNLPRNQRCVIKWVPEERK